MILQHAFTVNHIMKRGKEKRKDETIDFLFYFKIEIENERS